MARDENIAAAERLGAAINAHDLDGIENGFAEDALDHDPGPDQSPGANGFRAFFATMFEAFPDLRIDTESVVADGEQVAIAYTLTGTHAGDFHGVPATSQGVQVRGVQIARYHQGQIVERWGSTDELGLLTNLAMVHRTTRSTERTEACRRPTPQPWARTGTGRDTRVDVRPLRVVLLDRTRSGKAWTRQRGRMRWRASSRQIAEQRGLANSTVRKPLPRGGRWAWAWQGALGSVSSSRSRGTRSPLNHLPDQFRIVLDPAGS
ncbi:ester cyclase [Tenggerimyces flavus]|uniref:Ester cyclase n=1 Tax=Tenggerimyces flavus TaxID=1708749 RepID=A0ABV7Y7Q2_9ACTN|nr:ester cyclase [Tenggerimyces flavus]MBM7790069.1 steroid delta-isomerase-like uncharacterized protein [Tenggerimyces flavus]